MFQIRPFRNTDLQGIVAAWNELFPFPNVAVPISTAEYDMLVLSRPYFEAKALLVAESTQTHKIIGFVHCGFGPDEPDQFCRKLDRDLGALALICTPTDLTVAESLVRSGVSYLKSAGAKVIYAGGRYPLNPFYWGLYGGSEFSGILDTQVGLQQTLLKNGFQATARTDLFEFDLGKPGPRHFKNSILKRECRIQVIEDETPEGNWTSLALEPFYPLRIQVLEKNSEKEIASTTLWPMTLYGRRDGASRIGMVEVVVEESYRRKGFGRLLVMEAIKCAADLSFDRLCVQTDSSNAAASTLYDACGFDRSGNATLFRMAE